MLTPQITIVLLIIHDLALSINDVFCYDNQNQMFF